MQFAYRGLDDKVRKSVLTFDPVPPRLVHGAATYNVSLGSGATTSIFLSIACYGDSEPKPETFIKGLMHANRCRKRLASGVATVESSNDILNEVMCRSASDLTMLVTEKPRGLYPSAGIPWFSTTFGRDGIITALQTHWFDPRIAKGVLLRLAYFQATGTDPLADAEPGKILHEMRGGEMAALR